MKAILIEQDQSMLDLLQEKITRLSNIEILGVYTNHHRGLIELSQQEPDLAFLDISITGVKWIEVARQLKKAMPKMKIVFLDTCARQAIDAFEIQADDYILKPVEDTRLRKTIAKISAEKETQALEEQPMICCFQTLNFRKYGCDQDMLSVKWRTSKAREVFSYLVHKRGKFVRKDVIVDLFWPESPLKKAFSQLYSTIYQIRKSLSSIEFDVQIINSENNYKLELNNHLIDVDVWEEGIKTLPLITAENVEVHKKLIYLYKGDYFEEENFLWSMNEKDRLRVKWLNQVKRVFNYYMSINDHEEAILICLYYQKIIPYHEESYIELMKLYALYDDRYAVEEQYRLLKEMLADEFGDEPDEEVVAWYKNWSE